MLVVQLLHELPALLSDLDASTASVLQIPQAPQLPTVTALGAAAAPQRVMPRPGEASSPASAKEEIAATAAAAADVL